MHAFRKKGATIKTGGKLGPMSLVMSATDAEDGDLADRVEVADDGDFGLIRGTCKQN